MARDDYGKVFDFCRKRGKVRKKQNEEKSFLMRHNVRCGKKSERMRYLGLARLSNKQNEGRKEDKREKRTRILLPSAKRNKRELGGIRRNIEIEEQKMTTGVEARDCVSALQGKCSDVRKNRKKKEYNL